MLNIQTLYHVLDLLGTFAFAISGAVAARQKGLDMFGIVVVAFTVACGGGIIRDLCISATPPVGISDWRYLAITLLAALMTMGLYRLVEKLYQPVLLFDALGLSLFAVSGAQKALIFGHNAEVAVLLGTVTAVGGGVLRDVLLNRIPVIFRKEIYASAALTASLIVVAGSFLNLNEPVVSLVAIAVCFSLRYLSLRYQWNLPVFKEKGNDHK
ncbi:MAG TPA: trimeric intracellular cation channel family protein [Agriterribacter sp.]|nr:trimeric intracellular cation channel family protein [Agriterribacter sp.]